MIAFRRDVAVLLALAIFGLGMVVRAWRDERRWLSEASALRVVAMHRLTNQEPPVLLGERMEGTNRVRLLGVPTVVADAYVCGTAEGTNAAPLFRVLQIVDVSTNLMEIRKPK